MRVTKRDTKRIIKTWNKGGSEYEYFIKEKYNVMYLNYLENDIKDGLSAIELQAKYENYFENAGTNFGSKIPMQVWKNLSLRRYLVEETEEEFQSTKFNLQDIYNLLPRLEEEIKGIRLIVDYIQNSKSENLTNKRKLVDKFNELFEIKK